MIYTILVSKRKSKQNKIQKKVTVKIQRKTEKKRIVSQAEGQHDIRKNGDDNNK